MYLRYLLILFIFVGGHLYAQTVNISTDQQLVKLIAHQIDTLKELERSGAIKIDKPICALAIHSRYAIPNSSTVYPVNSLSYKGSEKENYLELCALENMGAKYYAEKKFPLALQYWNKALGLSIKDKFSYDELHHIRVALNNLFFLLDDLEGVMSISSEGLHTAEAIGDKERMAHFNNVLGCIMLKLNNLSSAKKYFDLELSYGREMNDQAIIAHALLNLTDLYQAEHDYGSAINSAQNAALAYANQNSSWLPERSTYCNYKISQTNKLWGKYPEAMNYSKKVMEQVRNIHSINLYDRAGYAINAAELFIMENRIDSALQLLYFALDMARTARHREYTRDAYEQLAKAYQLKGSLDSAFIYLQFYYGLRDSLVSENNEREIMQKEANLQLEKQKRSQDLAIANQKLWRNVFIAVAIVALLLLAFFYNRYRLRQKNFYQQELMRQQNELFNAVSVAQEQERKRIAQDLHDSLGSVLSAARLKLGALKDNYPGIAARDHFISSMQLIDEASSELRSIAYNIMPATLSKLGLVPALKNLSEKISSAGDLQVTFITYDLTERLSEQAELSIYRIILELINNVVKHSEASRATVQLIRFPGYINITVEDNGNGFSLAKTTEERTGIGLGSVYARVEYMKGQIDIDSAAGKGTSIFIEIPL